MPRPLRHEESGAVYHVTARGNRRAAIFADDVDRRTYLLTLAQTRARFRWRCLTYCLMHNHFHLVVMTPEPNLAVGMNRLNSLYAQSFNRRHRLTGHLFQGRYHSVAARTEVQVLEAMRYVALNPVRADLCESPGEWTWSGHRALAGTAPPGVVDVGAVWGMFDPADTGAGPARYSAFVEDGIAMRARAA
jgi:REP element-mobilizing transposase RayT